jgi:hypothetical protein
VTSVAKGGRHRNEESARMMTQKGFGKRNRCLHRHPTCGIFLGKTDEISRTSHLMHDGFSFDKILQNKCIILGQELNENNLRKWKVWSDRCQRSVADKTCGFLIAQNILRLSKHTDMTIHWKALAEHGTINLDIQQSLW